MAKFFFDVFDGQTFCDDDGCDLLDVDTARREAVKYAGRMILDMGESYLDQAAFDMLVRDEGGIVVLNLHFNCASTQAVQIAA